MRGTPVVGRSQAREDEPLPGGPQPADGGAAAPAAGGVDQGVALKILVLADRCWAHPQGGGTGANLYAQVSRWAAAGHQVTVIAGDYPGAERAERVAPNLIVHRMGGRATVFPLGIWAVMRGLGADADVVLEIINGITFLTPLWLRKPRVALVCHPHRELYTSEFGRYRGRLLAAVAEELPLRLLYRRAAFLTISESARDDLVQIDGVPRRNISVAYCGVEGELFAPGPRDPNPRLLYLGRLKAYKRIEYVLDVLEAIPGATLDIVGDGDHREALEAEIGRRGLWPRVEMHGHVDDATRAEMYARSWILITASSSEGWGLTVIEAALCGTASAALAVGGLRESIVDAQTGVLAQDVPELIRRVAQLIENRDQLEQLAAAARRRALTFTWERTASDNLSVLRDHAQVPASAQRLTPPVTGAPAGSGPLSVTEAPVPLGGPPIAAGLVDGRRADTDTVTGTERSRQWLLRLGDAPLEPVLTTFVARRIMRITDQWPGTIEAKGGSALALGKRARVLDWLPVRARIVFGSDGQGCTWVQASVARRGRPHFRRRLFDRLYEQKLTSWLADLDRTLQGVTAGPRAGVAGADSVSASPGADEGPPNRSLSESSGRSIR